MTITANARVAGYTYWTYFVAGISGMLLAGNAPATATLACRVIEAVPVFELTFATWLITKGVATPPQRELA